ncbi:MAG: O-antigen ligase family protein [Bacteroidia bacterium]|nr:O-antigen ligase family protein [Bacteroidia bacterium]
MQTAPKEKAVIWTTQNLAWALLMLFMLSLSMSKAIVSISMGGLALLAVWHVAKERSLQNLQQRSWIWFLLAIFVLAVVAGAWTSDKALWIKDLREKLPFLAIPLSLGMLPALSEKQKHALLIAFIIAQAIVALISLGIFFQDYEQGLYNISKNQSIDIIGSISHIYFGLFLSFSAFLAFFLRFNKSQEWPGWLKYLVFALGLINGVCLHLLTSRTGLVAFYGTAGIALIWWIVNRRAWLPGFILLGGLFILPIVAYQTIPSFKQRISVTIWDLNESKNPDRNIAELSVGTRFATWQTTWEVFLANPILGVGKGDMGAEMDKQYVRNGISKRSSDLSHEPHNQYLNDAASTGILGLLLLGLLFFQYILAIRRKNDQLFLLFTSLMLLGMFFESLLERQVGMSFFLIFSMILYPALPEAEELG